MMYQNIIDISNDIRSILDTSRLANLAAINAALAARRAGNVKGFEAVAGEVKAFSEKLTNAMQGMAENILGVSQAVSGMYRQRHSLRHHQTAFMVSQAPRLAVLLEEASDSQRRLSDALLNQVRRLSLDVSRALRLCLTGRNLARAAMVEAAYGGPAAGMLKAVAADIESTIDAIQLRLKAIHQRMR